MNIKLIFTPFRCFWNFLKKHRSPFIIIAVVIAVNVILRVAARSSPAFAEWYARYVYRALVEVIARVTNLLPFSVVEAILLTLPLLIIGCVVFIVVKKGKRLTRLLLVLRKALYIVLALITVFLFNCEINYQRKTFAEASGLTVAAHTPDELLQTINYLIDELNSTIAQGIVIDQDWQFVLNDDRLAYIAPAAMHKLAEDYPLLQTYYPQAKPLILSEFLSMGMTCGIYSPFTVEANYNRLMPDSEKPFTVCHELSHLSGFMREDEANFIAYLACRDSGDTDFRYSGLTRALTYAVNAYYGSTDIDSYYAMFDNIPKQVQLEFTRINEYWQPYREKPAAAAVQSINDAYLKANSQTDGVRSYGRFVDLLIADYIQNHSPEQE